MQKVTTQDMIALLNEIGEQVIVAMVERGDGEERDPAMDMLARKVQIINAIAERVQEMTAVEYLETFREIVDAYCSDEVGCRECPFGGGDFSVNVQCAFDETTKHPRRTVEIVRRWKEEQGNGTKAM